MENQTSPLETLFEKIKSYVETRIDLVKLKAIDKSSTIIATMIAKIVVILMLFFFIFFLNVGIALLLGDLLGKSYYGFFIVAGFYGITGLVFHWSKEKILKTPITNAIVKDMID